MERIWLKQYPAGVPADIDVTQYSSLVELLEESFAKFRERKAFICMDKSISFHDLDEMSLALAAYLQSKGMQKGARVALMMPNVLQYPISTTAVLRAGFAVVNVNPLYTPRELEHQLKDSGAEAIIVLENFATTVEQVMGKTSLKHVIVASMGDLLGLKGVIVNLVVRRVKKMVPPYSIPRAVAFNEALAAGRGINSKSPTSRAKTSPSCNIPAAPPASPRERRYSIATFSPTCCRTTPGCSRRWTSRPTSINSSTSARCRSTMCSR
jgi:long-chain acyl-CoA synthetase